ncbi:MBL fold metallo-hydrolase [Halomarina ordinaria]|uniref:MBL fold metallo-hydrolase n=1 Tax=Halomarina ordinaria TaxID=3033939 RepID=A0ABD5UKK8_9EURY|nr:MBL fold metallo-hydrolase [Halomarina sp. PSRA2]
MTRDPLEYSLAARVHRIETPVPWPPGHAAAFLVEGEEPVLVDAGHVDERSEDVLDEGLAERGYTVADIEHVVLTHPHSDHIGQVPAFVAADARLYAPRAVCEQLRRDPADLEARVRETAASVGLPPRELDAQVARAVDSLERNRRLLPPDAVAVPFEYGEAFPVADLSLEPVHTPGHQTGHACLFASDGAETVLFSGDALVEPFRAAALDVGLDRGAYDAVAAFYRGYGRLEAALDRREPRRVYAGHGPPFEDAKGVLERSRASLDRLVADVLATVERVGPASPYAVTLARLGGDELRYPAPLLDTVGALGTLDERGAVVYRVDDGVRRYVAV